MLCFSINKKRKKNCETEPGESKQRILRKRKDYGNDEKITELSGWKKCVSFEYFNFSSTFEILKMIKKNMSQVKKLVIT